MFPFLAKEIAPVRDRGAAAGNSPLEGLLRCISDPLPFFKGEAINPSPRVHAGVIQDFTGIDITDASYSALIHEK